MTDFWKLYEQYEEERLRKSESRSHYREVLHSIENHFHMDFLSLTDREADAYRKYLDSQPFADTTKDERLRIVKSVGSYFEMASFDGLIASYVSPFSHLKFFTETSFYEDSDIPGLTDIGAVLAAAEADENYRGFLAVTLALKLCLSTSEITNLKRKCFLHSQDGWQLSVPASEWKQRIIPVPDDVISLISSMMPEFFQASENFPLFSSRKSGGMSVKTLSRAVQAAAKTAGVSLTLQDVRKRGILMLLQINGDAEKVAQFAGIQNRWIFRYQMMAKDPIVDVNLPNIKVLQSKGIASPEG